MDSIRGARRQLKLVRRKNQILGLYVAPLGDDAWTVLLALYVNKNSSVGQFKSNLKLELLYPASLGRILSVLITQNLVETDNFVPTGGTTYRLTKLAIPKIDGILELYNERSEPSSELV